MQTLKHARTLTVPVCPATTCPTCPARHAELCHGVSDLDLAALFRASRRVRVSEGQSVILDGDAAEAVYIVIRGTLRLTRFLPDGRRQILAFLFTGHYIGFAREEVYHFNAEAVTDVELCAFEQPRFRAFVKANPQLIDNVARIAARVVEEANDTILMLGRLHAEERVAAFLLLLQAQSLPLAPAGTPIPMPMSRQDIADYLGLTNETVSRCLTRLRRSGTIALPSRHSVVIRNLARLRRAAGFSGEDDGDDRVRGVRPRSG